MKTSAKGRKLIEAFEGLSLKAYQEALGNGKYDVPTIGYGHTTAAGPPAVYMGMTITSSQADEMLANDLKSVEDDVLGVVKVPLNQNQFDALVSFTFNLGIGNLESSTLLRRLNAGDYYLHNEFVKWVKAQGETLPGLVARREREANLFDSASEATPQEVEIPATEGTGSWFVNLIYWLLQKIFGGS